MLVVPASMAVQLEAIRQGYMNDLLEAGCTFVTPGCAACLGTHEGLIAASENVITHQVATSQEEWGIIRVRYSSLLQQQLQPQPLRCHN